MYYVYVKSGRRTDWSIDRNDVSVLYVTLYSGEFVVYKRGDINSPFTMPRDELWVCWCLVMSPKCVVVVSS